MTMFLVWHFVLFSRTLIQLKKVTQSINKNCNSTHLSKLVTKFITNYSVFFSLEQFFIISIANLRNLFTSIFALFRARFHLRGFLLYLVIFFFLCGYWRVIKTKAFVKWKLIFDIRGLCARLQNQWLMIQNNIHVSKYFHLFLANALVLYHQKTPENLVFRCFQRA